MARAHPGETGRRTLRWLLVVAILVAVLGGVEWWARGTNPQLPSWHGPKEEGPGLMTGHPTRLWGMSAGERSNGQTTAFINTHGIRGELPEVPRPEGRARILTLGDSSFFGFLVSDEDVFTAHLQTYLRDQGVDVDVVNGGVAGYSIAQHKLFMDDVGWALEPTLIVYCNLWSDNTWDTFRDEDLLASRRFAQFNPLVHSAAFRLLAARFSQPESDQAGRVILWRGDQSWPEGKTRRVPLSRFIALHDEVIRDAASRGIGGAFMIPTNSSLLGAVEPPHTPFSWEPYFEAFRRLGDHHSMPVISLTGALRGGLSEGLSVDDLLLDLMHPSPEGHRRIAESLGAALLETGWPNQGLVGVSTPLDASDLQDLPNIRWTEDIGAGSPQRNLFEISEEEQEAIAERAAARAESGPVLEGGPILPALDGEPELPMLDGEPAAPVFEGAPAPPVPVEVPEPPAREEKPELPGVSAGRTPPPGSAWKVKVTVVGGTPPYKLVVRDSEGRPASSARLIKPTTVGLMVRAGLSLVYVEVTDGTGVATATAVSQTRPQTTLTLP